MSETKGYSTLKGLSPSGDKECEFKIANKQIDHFFTCGPDYKFYELKSVAEVLTSPLIIAEGLKRDGKERAFGYIGKPRRFGEDWDCPPPPDMVFLVCMSRELVVFEWGWEKEDPNNANYPKNAGERFETIKWKRSTII